MSVTKRLEALEAAAAKAEGPEKFDVVLVIVAPDRSIDNAFRHGEGGALVPVSEDELADIRHGR